MPEIKEQYIKASTKAKFQERLNSGDISQYSIVFIEDTKEIWTRGSYYNCADTSEEVSRLFDEVNKNLDNHEQAIEQLRRSLYANQSTLVLSANPDVFEKGLEQAVTLKWEWKLGNEDIIPDTLILKNGEDVISTDSTSNSVNVSLQETSKITLQVTYMDITKNAEIVIEAHYPMFFGGNVQTALVSSDILNLERQKITSKPQGEYSFPIKQGEYAWLCIPDEMSINNITCQGIDIPITAPSNVPVQGRGNYKCYHSIYPLALGAFKFNLNMDSYSSVSVKYPTEINDWTLID